MPQTKPKPSEVAAEAKRYYVPYIERTLSEFPMRSVLYADSSVLRVAPSPTSVHRLKVAVIDGDPVDVALDWYSHSVSSGLRNPMDRIPVVNMANEKRAGGDWESGLMAPEECLSRRSSLVQALVTPWYPTSSSTPHYPIPQRGGLYSPSVVVFRNGPDYYELWGEFKSIPVISVAPVRRPKLDESGTRYSFDQERELMMEKMRAVLRIAKHNSHPDICLGAFGIGPVFRNPISEVAKMWQMLLFHEEEFRASFSNVVFAIESSPPGQSRGSSAQEFEIFKREFDPANIFQTSYR